MNYLALIVFAMHLNIPDSVFSPFNAIKLSPPEWKFLTGENDTNYVELGYHTDYKLKIGSFFLGVEEDYDYDVYDRLKNRYFLSTPYFSISHSTYGIYRNKSQFSLFLRDTMDFYFSLDKFVPNITFLPGVHYFKNDTLSRKIINVPASLSIAYSTSGGVLTYGSLYHTDLLTKNADNILRLGVGIMSNRKSVLLGLSSKWIPEFTLKLLLINGLYIDAHYGYDLKTPDIFSYLYPDSITYDSVLSVMEKRFHLLMDKEPLLVDLTYSIPDTIFEKSLKLNLSFKTKHIDILVNHFRLFGNNHFQNKGISKGKAILHVFLLKGLSYNPYIEVYKVQDKNGKAYNIGGKLKYNIKTIQFFWIHNILNIGEIEDLSKFFTARRFTVGARYSF